MGDDLLTRDQTHFGAGDLLEGKYRILRPLAEGGMGSIFHASHEKLGRDVAVKVLKPIENEAPEKHHERIQRFYREASFSSQLNHPNTMTIFDYGELAGGGGFFLVMEYLEGKSLRETLDQTGGLPAATALHIAIQIASSLADAHGSGVIHRDLKPPNVMLVERGGDPYFVKVVDFGLVKRLHDNDGDDELTAENTVIGSPIYIAPERFLQKDADSPAVDVYALGIILYEMIVGRPPFTRDGESTVHQLILKHVQQPPPPISTFRPDLVLPEGLETLIMKCLEKDPSHRIPSMESLLTLMKSCARGLEYNPHSSISPFTDTGPIRGEGSRELLFGGETGQNPAYVTADHTRPGIPSISPATAEVTGNQTQAASLATEADTKNGTNKTLVVALGVVLLLVLVVALSFSILSSDSQLDVTPEPAPSPADTLSETLDPDPGEASPAAREDSLTEEEIEEPVAAEPAAEEPAAPEPATEEPPPARRTRPERRPQPAQDEAVPPRPPVQIKMDR